MSDIVSNLITIINIWIATKIYVNVVQGLRLCYVELWHFAINNITLTEWWWC